MNSLKLDHSYIDEYAEEVDRMANCLEAYDIDINMDLYDPVHEGCFESSDRFVEKAGLIALAKSEEKLTEYMEELYDEFVAGRIGIEGPIGRAQTDIALDYRVTLEEGEVSRYWKLNPGIADTDKKVTEEQLRNIEAAVRECTESVEGFKEIENVSEALTSMITDD